MAGRGPTPKNPATRRRSAPKTEPMTEVAGDGRLRGPALTPSMLGGEPWHPRTLAWWATWRKSPQAKTFTPTDWDFLIDTALMHHTMWSKGRWEFAAELRLRAAKFGATPEDRMRLKITIDQAPTKPAAPANADNGTVTSIASRRARLTG